MGPAESDIKPIITDCLRQLRSDLSLLELPAITDETPLFGSGSDLDSMGVVHLIADLEGRLEEKFGLNWILADERALSRTRSPFRTVAELTRFIVETTPEN